MSRDKSSTAPIPLDEQRAAWNEWNTSAARHVALDSMVQKQVATVVRWLRDFRPGMPLRILDAGCGSGWLCKRLLEFGRVTGVDLADDVIARAQRRWPGITFIAGDFMEVDLPRGYFDVVTCFELLAHVADQAALVEKLASLVKARGLLLISTQNRPVLEHCSWVNDALPGTLRHWLDAAELRELLASYFDVEALTSVHPVGNQGWRRIVNSRWVSTPLDVLSLGGYTRLRERKLLGWSLMLRCRRRL